MMELWAEATCELAHSVKSPLGVDVIHGHSYWVRMSVESDPQNPVRAMELQAWLQKLLRQIDHGMMNNLIPSGTMEEMALWIEANMTIFKPTRIQIERKSLGLGIDYRP